MALDRNQELMLDLRQAGRDCLVFAPPLEAPQRNPERQQVLEVQRLVPALVLADPSAFQARQAVTSIGYGRLADAILPDLVIGVSEAVSNAWRHGRPPVMVRIWTASGRMLVRVHDTGPGPGNPLAGLAPAWAGPGLHGAGLWLIRMLGLDAALIRSRDGFTVRLAAGQPAWR
jgi:anti-sigma regulatory factor (Ser/Thr protein kinase)